MRASAASWTSLPLPLAREPRSGDTLMRWPLRPASSERREAASLSVRRRPPPASGLSLAAAEAAASVLWETLRSADSRGGPRPRENGDSPGADMRLGEPEDERRRSWSHVLESLLWPIFRATHKLAMHVKQGATEKLPNVHGIFHVRS